MVRPTAKPTTNANTNSRYHLRSIFTGSSPFHAVQMLEVFHAPHPLLEDDAPERDEVDFCHLRRGQLPTCATDESEVLRSDFDHMLTGAGFQFVVRFHFSPCWNANRRTEMVFSGSFN